MTVTLTATRPVFMPFTDGFAMSGMNLSAWRLATDAAYASEHAGVRPLTARTIAQHQAIQAVKNVPAFKTPAAQGTKGSSPWRFPV